MKISFREKVYGMVVLLLDGKPVRHSELNNTIFNVIELLGNADKRYYALTAAELDGVYEYVEKRYALTFKVI